jgi:glutamine amidotransferase
VPQIGWNTLEPCSPELQGLAMAYYANSYVCQPEDTSCVTAWSIYDDDCFAASVRGGPRGNVIGVQFHPEKSSTAGVRFLRALVDGACAESRP